MPSATVWIRQHDLSFWVSETHQAHGFEFTKKHVWPLAPSEEALRQTKNWKKNDLGIRVLDKDPRIETKSPTP